MPSSSSPSRGVVLCIRDWETTPVGTSSSSRRADRFYRCILPHGSQHASLGPGGTEDEVVGSATRHNDTFAPMPGQLGPRLDLYPWSLSIATTHDEKNDSVVDRRSSIERSVIRLAAEQEVALAVAVDIPTSVTCPIPRTLHPLTAFLVHAAPGCVLVMHHNTTEHQAANKSKGHRYTLPWHIAPMHGSPTTSWRKERIHNRQEC
jgi:hypothetical protein